MGAAEDSMERWDVDKEHDKCAACKDPDKVVLITDDGFSEWKAVFCLDRKNLCEES